MPELHLVYRPQNWDEVFGNETVKETLKNRIEKDDLPHSIMLTGPRGCSKTTISRLIAHYLGASKFGIVEVNVGLYNKVEDMRELLSGMKHSTLAKKGDSKVKVYILDEFHMASNAAQNAILKDSEEAPRSVYFIICTTEVQKILPTIKSRFTRYEVKPLNDDEMTDLLKWVCDNENKKISQRVLDKIIEAAEGIPRDALVCLGNVIDVKDASMAMELISTGIDNVETLEICKMLAGGASWGKLGPKLKVFKEDPENTRYAILGYMSACLLNGGESKFSKIISCFEPSFMYTKKAGLVNACFRAVKG